MRERGNDVLLLAGRFLELNRARLGLRSLRLSSRAEDALLRYRWPRNVRELEHVVSRASLKAVSRGAGRQEIVTLEADMLDLDALQMPAGAVALSHEAAPAGTSLPQLASMQELVEASQLQAIRQALPLHHDNWAAAARQLHLDASNLHKLARRLGMKTITTP